MDDLGAPPFQICCAMLLCSRTMAGSFDVLMSKHDYMSACQQYVLCDFIHLTAGHPMQMIGNIV